MVMAWIQLLGLLGFLYKRRVLEEIGGTIKVAKIDFNTDNKTRGWFAQMAVYSSTVEKEQTKSASNEVVGGGDASDRRNRENVVPLSPIGNEAALLDNVGLDISGLILKSLGKKPMVNIGPSIISSGPVEACNVDSKSIKKVYIASSSCTKLFVIRDEIESRDPMIIPLRLKEMVVNLNNTVLDTRKHSAVTFKEINDQNRGSLEGGEGHTDGYDKTFVSKGRDPRVKGGQIRSGIRLNWTIRDLGEQFKLVSNSTVPLADSMNSIVEPISAQLNTKAGNVFGSPSGTPLDKSRNFEK
ncbi:hypothetical protein Gogos_000663 [Gossypium gossypioides]|uniref:DUF4283 domain-containing protein n=1 Tax=Gossypium gossypioides TaxID=34282 RepID=A0A7J9CTB8_GOSGO|nr:hypothetical protein [Gossypium gossypioides]